MRAVFRTTDEHGPEQISAGRNIWGTQTIAHCYRIGATLLDAGPPNAVDRVTAHLGDGIRAVILTHSHEDHVGAAAALWRAGATVRAPADTLAALQHPRELPRYRRIAWGTPEPVTAQPLEFKVETPDTVFELIPAPGHSPAQVTFFEPYHHWLFSGDAFLGPKRSVFRFDERLDPMIESWRRLAALDASTLFPGHGEVLARPTSTLERAVEHYTNLRRRAWRLRDAGHSVPKLTRHLLGPEGFVTYYTGGEFSKQNLVRELLAAPPS